MNEMSCEAAVITLHLASPGCGRLDWHPHELPPGLSTK